MTSKHIAVWPRVKVFPLGGEPVVVLKGELLPKGIAAAELENLTSFGAIAGVTGLPDDTGDKELELDPALFDPAVGGGVRETLAYVGTDKARATEMLALEQAKGEKARSSLVEKLESVVTDPDGS